MTHTSKVLYLKIIGVDICVYSDDVVLLGKVQTLYSAFETGAFSLAAIEYDLGWSGNPLQYTLRRRQPEHLFTADDIGMLFFQFEKDATIEIQKLRPELFFLHSAALEKNAQAILIIAPSGTGKSTLSWALTQRGYRYLSDELAPVALDSLNVTPYPHALCLKADPPVEFPLPAATIRTTRTLHVPTTDIPIVAEPDAPVVLAGVFFLSYDPMLEVSSISSLSAAEGGMRIYANALNQLAHADAGLPAAISIASRVPCFLLQTGKLDSTVTLLDSYLNGKSR